LLVIFAVAVVVFEVLRRFGLVVVPVALALALAALLLPAVDFLDRYGAARGGAVAFVVVMGLTAVVGILAFVVSQFVEGLPGLVDQMAHSIESVRDWLINGPMHLSSDQLNNIGDTVIQSLRGHQEQLTSGALSTAGTIAELVTAALLTLFTLIFFLLGGRNIWEFVTRVVPQETRSRATFLVALVDAAGIGIGLAIMGIPLALPLASLVFLGAFIPLVGAVLSGFLAVIVALLAKGFIFALITLGLIIAVMQLEAHVLQPLVMGRAVSLHPLAVVLGIAAGSVMAGIVGALLAVPTIAFLNSSVRVLVAADPSARDDALAAEDGPLLEADVDEQT
jgi:predicted PurR-regulated permease PerM